MPRRASLVVVTGQVCAAGCAITRRDVRGADICVAARLASRPAPSRLLASERTHAINDATVVGRVVAGLADRHRGRARENWTHASSGRGSTGDPADETRRPPSRRPSFGCSLLAGLGAGVDERRVSLRGQILLSGRRDTMHDSDADQAKRTNADPLCRHAEHVGAKRQSNDQDEVADQIDSERHPALTGARGSRNRRRRGGGRSRG